MLMKRFPYISSRFSCWLRLGLTLAIALTLLGGLLPIPARRQLHAIRLCNIGRRHQRRQHQPRRRHHYPHLQPHTGR